MKNIILISIIMLLSLSCKKERTIIIKAVNPVTGEPYVGLGVSVRSCRSGTFEDKCKNVYEGTTNENGVAMINTRLNTNRRHTVFIEAPDDYCFQNEPSYTVDESLESQEFTFEYAPCAFLKLKIENVNCQGFSDNFKLYHEGSDIGFKDINPGQPIIDGEGCFFYEGASFSNVPMGRRFYRWVVTKNGSQQTFYDTLNLTAGEERIYEINY